MIRILTDYALNELASRDRLYRRIDPGGLRRVPTRTFTDLIDLGQLLEDGFERDEVRVEDRCLPASNAANFYRARNIRSTLVRKAAAVLAARLVSPMSLVHPALLPNRDGRTRGAGVSGAWPKWRLMR